MHIWLLKSHKTYVCIYTYTYIYLGYTFLITGSSYSRRLKCEMAKEFSLFSLFVVFVFSLPLIFLCFTCSLYLVSCTVYLCAASSACGCRQSQLKCQQFFTRLFRLLTQFSTAVAVNSEINWPVLSLVDFKCEMI